MTKRRRHTRGSALVEMTLALPLAIAVLYGSLYLSDLGLFKLKALELARYEAWGMATRQLSDFVNGNPASAIPYAQSSVSDEVTNVYADLDGANAWTTAGESRLTAGAMIVPLTTANITSTQSPIIPGIGSQGYADQLSALGQIVRTLGIGPDLDSVVGAIYEKLGFDSYGLISGSSSLTVFLPWVANDAARAVLLSQVAAQQGADLSAWLPVGGFIIGDQNNQPVATTLLGDPWRLPEGFSSGVLQPRSYTATVRRLQGNVPQIIPVIGLFLSQLTGAQNLQVISRPYNTQRDPSDPANTNAPRAGQVDIFALTGAKLMQEPGSVGVFESGALYDDPNNRDASPYLLELNSRGNAFMGCPYAERRGCQ